ncbi:hypothetical protein THAOC_15333, partial [Thalassiosira oceanica]
MSTLSTFTNQAVHVLLPGVDYDQAVPVHCHQAVNPTSTVTKLSKSMSTATKSMTKPSSLRDFLWSAEAEGALDSVPSVTTYVQKELQIQSVATWVTN